MNRKIYVGNLGTEVTMDDLDRLFSAHGEVKNVSVQRDKHSGMSRGFGYVEMRSPQEAAAAIAALNFAELGGRHILVNAADDSKRAKNRGRR